MTEKRKRGQNFSLQEKYKLIKLLLRHKETILNKKTDGATNEAKNCSWIAITNSFNSTSKIHRNKESLMKMWEKLKSESKKYVLMQNNATRNGDVLSTLKIDPILEKVCAFLGRGCTEKLEVPDSDAETELETEKAQIEEISDSAELQIYERINMENNLVKESKADGIQELRDFCTNKTSLWSRKRPHISNNNERTEATSLDSHKNACLQNVNKKRETVEDLKGQILREELEFKRKLYDLQLQAAAKELEIKTAILDQIKGGGISLSNLFGFQNDKK
ncbi:uncharacterized protein LOC110382059 isoform X1 [Helicoverpa armigera]|uniref:uncharacterized protein LOC110382059 isoform X1 n=1 Tax=Helicoverpa armigera TaxID=29058 RepID=UPI003083ABAF